MNLGAYHLGERSLSHQSNAPQGRPWGSGKEGGQDEGDHSRRSSTAVRSASASPTGSLGRMATRLPARTASVVPGGVQGTDSGVLALAKQQYHPHDMKEQDGMTTAPELPETAAVSEGNKEPTM